MKINISEETKKASKKLEAKTKKEYTNRKLRAEVQTLKTEVKQLKQDMELVLKRVADLIMAVY